MSFLGLGNALNVNANSANNGPGPQLHNGRQLPSSYYLPGLNIANALPPLLPKYASFGPRSSGVPADTHQHNFPLQSNIFPSSSSWHPMSSSNVANTSTLGIPPQHVRVLESSAGLSATSLILPPASTRPRHLQNSPVTKIMLDSIQSSSLAESIERNNPAQEDFLSPESLLRAYRDLANTEALDHPSSVAGEGIFSANFFREPSASQVLQPNLHRGTTTDSDALNDQCISSTTGISDDHFNASFENTSIEPSSSNTLQGNGFNTQIQITSDLFAAVLPLGDLHIALDLATDPSHIPCPQFALPEMTGIIASRGEAKQTARKYCDHGNDTGLATSSRDTSVELPQCRYKHFGQRSFSGLVDLQISQPRNRQAPETQNYTSVHVTSPYSELAHALTPVVQTPVPGPLSSTSSTSSTPSNLTHTLFPTPPASGALSTTSSSSLTPATIQQNNHTDWTQKSGPGSPSRHSQQEDNGPRSLNRPATRPPFETGRKKRKFDDLDHSPSSSPATSPLQDKTDAQPSVGSLAQPDETDESGPKPKRKRGRPKKPKAPSSQSQWKGFRPIARRPSASPPMTIARSTASSPSPSSLSGPSSWEGMRDVRSAHGSTYPTTARNGQDLEEMVDVDDLDQERSFTPLLHRQIVLEPYEG
ncbi:hypothetical protein CVT26_007697 [Gymnopilus dilepis]|uniref:Uncharacterized protein n=1 Tax=Gymnopilus dilepis TaxID=231916 RepID=A0A409WIF1_9AGAR|nr:hypothetical protein CVT26_007697 [Gymnopilus dilepis]